ncbi:MAG TPA: GntR family transcriptional regulator [Longimicrobiales bacterium]|nr:GntR family transcriptional regulator [Longimicrobiales bacterium]
MNAFGLSSTKLPLRPTGRGDRIQVVYEQLRTEIVRGRLEPGARIVETEVAASLGVSRTPVRAALQRLEAEGYVFATGHAQSRMCVAPLTVEDARELFSIVGEIESLATRHAAAAAPATRRLLVVRLRAINTLLRRAAASATLDPGRALELDQAFHDVIVAAGAGPRLTSLHAAIKPQIERYARRYARAFVAEAANSVAEHERVACALEAGDTDAACGAMRQSWQDATRRLARVIEGPAVASW